MVKLCYGGWQLPYIVEVPVGVAPHPHEYLPPTTLHVNPACVHYTGRYTPSRITATPVSLSAVYLPLLTPPY